MTSTLEPEFRQVLISLECTSNGRIYSYQPVGTSTGFSSGDPMSGDPYPPHIRWAIEWRRSNTFEHQQRTLDGAKDELKTLKKRQAPHVAGESQPQFHRRIAETGEGLTLTEAAVHFRCGQKDIVQARLGHGRDRETGKLKPTTDRMVIRARQMVAKGFTQRQIAQVLDVSQPTVHRLLAA